MGYTYYTTYTPTAGYSATWSSLVTRSGANSSGYSSIEQTQAFSGSRGYRTYRYTSESGSTNIYDLGPGGASYTNINYESGSGNQVNSPTSSSESNSSYASQYDALNSPDTTANYASSTSYASTASGSASTQVTHQYNYTTTSTSSSYYPSTSTTQSSTTTTTGTYSSSDTYEDGTDTITETYTDFATASTFYTSSNWTTTDGPTVTTSSYSHTITTSTVATASSSRLNTILATSSYSVGDTLVDLAAIYEAAGTEVYYSITATVTGNGLLTGVAVFFTKTTVTATENSTVTGSAVLTSTISNYGALSSNYVPTSNVASWTNTTTTTGGTVTYTAGRYTTVTETYGTTSDSLPMTESSTQTLRLLTTTTSSVTVHSSTTYSATAQQESTTTTTRSQSYTTTGTEIYLTTNSTTSTTDSFIAQTAADYTTTTTATLAHSYTTSSSRSHTTVLARTENEWPFDYSEDGGYYSVTAHAGATYHAVAKNSVSLRLTTLAADYWQATQGWNDPNLLGGTEARYLAMSQAGASFYYPFTAQAGPGGRLALVLYSQTTRAITGDSEYTYAYSASSLSYSLNHTTDSTSTTAMVTFSGVSEQTHYYYETLGLLIGTTRRTSFGGVPEVSTQIARHHFTGAGAFAVTKQGATESTVETITAEATFASIHNDHALAIVPEYLVDVRSVQTVFPVYTTALGAIGILTRHPNL
jgi:trimeric autotransporter adhesin